MSFVQYLPISSWSRVSLRHPPHTHTHLSKGQDIEMTQVVKTLVFALGCSPELDYKTLLTKNE